MIWWCAVASALTGDFSGMLQSGAGPGLPVVFHLGDTASTMDSPSQGATGIPVQVVVEGVAITIDVRAIGGKWTGKQVGERLVGVWFQGQRSFDLELRPGLPQAPRRPQSPVSPLPYTEAELAVPVMPGVVLAGTLATPAGPGPHPYVVMITGSGPQDRNESLAGHQPFRVIADRLARAGIGSYRYDDRGVGASVGDFSAATSHDFAIEAIAALKALRARGITQVGYLGHSEGGLVGPLAQLEQPGDFLVLLAPPGVPGAAIAQEQAVRIAEAAGVKPDELEQIRRTNAAVFAVLERKGSHAELKQALSILPEAEARAQLAQLSTAWFQIFAQLDPAKALQPIRVPVLALIGGRDLQVVPSQNLEPLRKALADCPDATVEEVPGLNHLFQPTATGLPAEYGTIETTFDEATLARIASWILAVTARSRSR